MDFSAHGLRCLKKDRKISEAWLEKLEAFFGIDRKQILDNFYQETTSTNLFGEEVVSINKKKAAIKKISQLYAARIKEIFTHVSAPYELINRQNSVMFHLYLASNNANAVKIANEIIDKLKRNAAA